MSFIDTIRSQISTPRNVPQLAAIAVISTDRGRVAKANVKRLRAWSEHSEWIRAAINIRKTQVTSAEWDIVTADADGRTPDIGLQREIRDRLEFANPKAENFQTLMEKVVEDIVVLDAGCIEIEPNLRGEPLYLHDVDGGTVRVSMLWDGTNPQEPRYFWYPDNFERGRWTNDQFIYIMETPRSNSVVGLSKLETLALSIDAELEGHAYNARQVRNAAPDGLLHLGKGAKQQNIDSFRAFWQAEQGRGAMAITGGTEPPSFTKFQDTNRDMQFLEWQIYLVRKIAAVMGMDPGDLGLGMDINRSTAEVRDNQTEDRGIRPLMGLLQRHLTREFVWHPEFGGQDNNLSFKWTKLNLRESAARAAIYKIALGGMPYKAVNEARKSEGLEPWGPEFDQPAMVSPQGAFSLEDLPTVREFMDSKAKPAPAAIPSGPTSKEIEELGDQIASVRDIVLAMPPGEKVDYDAIATMVEGSANHRFEGISRAIDEALKRELPATNVTLNADQSGLLEVAGSLREAVVALTEREDPPPPEPPVIHVGEPIVKVEAPAVSVAAPVVDMSPLVEVISELKAALAQQAKPITRREVKRDAAGRIIEVIDHQGE